MAVYTRKAIFGVCGMLIFGTGTMVASKMLLDTESVGLDGVSRAFSKPWYQSTIMFSAMSSCILAHFIAEFIAGRRVSRRRDLLSEEIEPHKKVGLKGYLLIAIPAMFDLAATTCMTYGLTKIPVSVMQMLRGSMIAFSAIFNIAFLKRKLRAYHWCAVCGCLFACAVVGFSSIQTAAASSVSTSISDQIIGICMVLVSQFIQAGQIVAEDFLLSNVDTAPLQVVGMEGVWGFFLCICICLPIAGAIPGSDAGSMENSIDTMAMIKNSGMVQVLSLVYWVSILFLNYAGMLVTSELTSVVRTMWEGIRTLAIWVTNLFIAYIAMPNTIFGEEWSFGSYLQLAGFTMLITSTYCYNGIIKFPVFAKRGMYAPVAPKVISADE